MVKSGKKSAPRVEPPYSHTRPPRGVPAAGWQTSLRRQFGREQNFELENIGKQTFFSDFRVTNPATGGSYRVAIRGAEAGENYCSCPDYETNDLGTCKHVEFVLGQLEKRRGAKTAFRRGYSATESELWLQYGAQRTLRLRLAADVPAPIRAAAAGLFDGDGYGHVDDAQFERIQAFMDRAADAGVVVHADARAFVRALHAAAQTRAQIEAAFPAAATDANLAALLNIPLFPYQAEGALFAARAGRASSPTTWGWARRCRPSRLRKSGGGIAVRPNCW